eukprot:gene12506-2281_t
MVRKREREGTTRGTGNIFNTWPNGHHYFRRSPEKVTATTVRPESLGGSFYRIERQGSRWTFVAPDGSPFFFK